jgi:hypothetical protein
MLFYIRTGTAVVEKEFEDESKGKEHVRDSSQDFGTQVSWEKVMEGGLRVGGRDSLEKK